MDRDSPVPLTSEIFNAGCFSCGKLGCDFQIIKTKSRSKKLFKQSKPYITLLFHIQTAQEINTRIYMYLLIK